MDLNYTCIKLHELLCPIDLNYRAFANCTNNALNIWRARTVAIHKQMQ